MKKREIKYNICMPSEMDAGIRGFNDEITITIDSGDPGGEEKEFEQFMLECLREWYDGARITLESSEETP